MTIPITNQKPKALDLFCGAGGASMGLYRAGYDVTGVDIVPQPRYPFTFIQGDALTYPLVGYDLIWASPPCQFASILTPSEHRPSHPNLIPTIRARLAGAGVPYIIENVAGARAHLIAPVMLCGSMFGLGVWRHRYFECSPAGPLLTPACNHSYRPVVVSGRVHNGPEPSTEERRAALGTPWMGRLNMDVAIPPAYSEWLGKQVRELIF